MSVEKYKPEFGEGKIKHEPKPFTQIKENMGAYTTIPNEVFIRCHNPKALALYCYLKSLDKYISPKEIQDHFVELTLKDVNSLIDYLEKIDLLKNYNTGESL